MWAKLDIKALQKSHPRSSDRSFAFLMGVVGVALFILKGHMGFLVSAAVFFVGGVIEPRMFCYLNQAWQSLGLVLGWLMTPIILTLLYFAGFMPMALIVKLCGHRAFAQKTGWIEKKKPCRFDKIF